MHMFEQGTLGRACTRCWRARRCSGSGPIADCSPARGLRPSGGEGEGGEEDQMEGWKMGASLCWKLGAGNSEGVAACR